MTSSWAFHFKKQWPLFMTDLQNRHGGLVLAKDIENSPCRLAFPGLEAQLANDQVGKPAPILRCESVALRVLLKFPKSGLQFLKPFFSKYSATARLVHLIPLKLFFDAIFSLR